jgi:hypothetical protein
MRIESRTTTACWEGKFSEDFHNPCFESLIKCDQDGQQFIDIFNPLWENVFPPTEFISSSDVVPANPIEFLKEAWKRIKTNRKAYRGNAEVLAKYEWLARECAERAAALGTMLDAAR